MNRKMTTGLASALLLMAAPACAATPSHAGTTAPQTKVQKAATHVAAMQTASWTNTEATTLGDREVHALNALELAGYRKAKNLHPQGQNIVATAEKSGTIHSVIVTPEGKVRAKS